jgi:HlyD family secretion protein
LRASDEKLRVAVAVLVLLAAGGAAAWSWRQQQQQRLPNDIVRGSGRIKAQEIHIAAKHAGRLAEVSVEEGDMVEAGQVVARLEVRFQLTRGGSPPWRA